MKKLAGPRKARSDRWHQCLWVRWSLGGVGALVAIVAVGILWDLAAGAPPWRDTIGRFACAAAGLAVAIVFASALARLLQREDGLGCWIGAFVTLALCQIGIDLVWAGLTGARLFASTFGQIVLYAQALFWLFVIALAAVRLLLQFNWAPLGVARTVLAEALRMKIAMVFVIGLLLILPVLPFMIDPTEPVRYRVQTFLTYSLMAVTVLLGLMTIFLSCSSLSAEIAQKQIHTIVAKPIGRGAFLFGKWLGIALLNLVLLLVGGSAIYGFAVGYIAPQAEQEVRNQFEIVLSGTPDRQAEALREQMDGLPLEEQLAVWVDAQWEQIIRGWSDRDAVTVRRNALAAEPMLERMQQLPERFAPLKLAVYEWKQLHDGVLAARVGVEATPPVPFEDLARERFKYLQQHDPRMVEQFGEEEVMAQLTDEVENNWLRVPVYEYRKYVFEGLGAARDRNQTIHVRFKVFGDAVRGRNELAFWVVANGRRKAVSTPAGNYRVLELPAAWIDDHGKLELAFGNINPERADQPNRSDLSFRRSAGMQVLYRVGGFDMNFARTLAILWARLAFLAMLGLAAATFLSFPIASLLSLLVFSAAMGSPFIIQAANVYNSPGETNPVAIAVERGLRIIGRAFGQVVQQYAEVSPIEQVATGLVVPWSQVLGAVGWIMVIWTGAVGLTGWLVFRSRELARVQV